jgi:hypothetical protein
VQDRLKLVSAVKALIVFEPEAFLLPVQPPDAEQLLALALLQVNVVEPLKGRFVGLALSPTVGAAGAPTTVTLTESLTLSASPVQVIVNPG